MKYTFVCDPNECDALLEFTARDGFDFPNGVVKITCPCGRQMQYISANIIEQEQQKEEAPVETIEYLQKQATEAIKTSNHWQKEIGRLRSQIIDVVDEIYAGNWTDEEDIANTLCQIIDYSPTKEIEFTATMRFTGRIDVPANEVNSFDLLSVLEDAYVDINNGDVVIDGYHLEDAEEC